MLVDVIYRYLDQQKSFDSVLQNRLLHKVENYGDLWEILNWIKGFLFDRDQCVVLNGYRSTLQMGKGIELSSPRVNPWTFTFYHLSM